MHKLSLHLKDVLNKKIDFLIQIKTAQLNNKYTLIVLFFTKEKLVKEWL